MERFSGSNITDEPIELPPGFRFHPMDEELITHYLSPKVLDSSFSPKAIGDVDLNKVEPWDLPWKANMGEKEWYFFCVKDRKYPTGLRTNRATEAGYWKATGKDKEIFRAKILVGMKKTLVFYKGRAPRGEKTDWVMHEYRLEGKIPMQNLPKTGKNEWVICRVFKKSSGGKKVHISGLMRSRDGRENLPPLMDLSSDENQTVAGEGSHVTCFSKPVEDHRDKSVDELSSSSSKNNNNFPLAPFMLPKVSYHNPTFSSSFMGNSQHMDPVIMQDQSILRLLLEGNSQNNAGLSSSIYSYDQELPIIPNGEIDFDCLWDY